MQPTDPARPVQLEQIKRKARDAGLTSHELDLLCQHVAGCAYNTLSVQGATDVLAWQIATGPDRAKWRINEIYGQRTWL